MFFRPAARRATVTDTTDDERYGAAGAGIGGAVGGATAAAAPGIGALGVGLAAGTGALLAAVAGLALRDRAE